MKQAAAPSGTSKDATKESILLSELNKLQEGRDRFKAANELYVQRHPELRTILDEFMANVIESKPSDILKFAVSYFAGLRTSGGSGFPVLAIVGPPGVGKTTLVKMLMDRNPDAFQFHVETTTRTPKAGEVNGVHFNFVTKEQFDAMVANNEFLTHRQVYQNQYGTTIKALEQVRQRNKICIMDVDIETTHLIRASSLESKLLFIAPKSIEALELRLKKMQKDNELTIARKVEKGMEDMAYGTEPGVFDEVIVNDKLEPCYREVVFTLLSWYSKCTSINVPDAADEKEQKAAAAAASAAAGGTGTGGGAGAKSEKK